jgi:hypothetical protein
LSSRRFEHEPGVLEPEAERRAQRGAQPGGRSRELQRDAEGPLTTNGTYQAAFRMAAE